jgi:lipoprotein-anchoring transpeptidase ErfK/SrfK
VARLGLRTANGYPTVLGVLAEVVDRTCAATWYRVQLPIKPNGSVGYVRASALRLEPVTARIEVDLSRHRLVLYRDGQRVMRLKVGVGAHSTPTPTGRYYVNQRFRVTDAGGPFGPAALGISAFSTVLTDWAQGGPIAIHGTNVPASIGRWASHGCIRVDNGVLLRLFRAVPAGTPVVITA